MSSYTDWWSQGQPSVAGGDVKVVASMLADDLDPLKDGDFTTLHKHVAAEDTPVNAVAALLTTSLTGTNNDMVFTAVTKGVVGNTITIAYVDPEEETATEVVTVVGTAITVTLRSVSSVLSTAAQVKTAYDLSAAAIALATVANAGGNNGSGAVIALTATALDGGVDGTVGASGELKHDATYLYVCKAANTTADQNWRRISLGSTY